MYKKIQLLNYISIIVLNIVRIRDLYNKLASKNLLDSVILVKDISKFTLNLLSFNIISIFSSSINLYSSIKKNYKNIIEKLRTKQ